MPDIFSKLSSAMGGLLGGSRSGNSVLGIDFGSSGIKAVQVKKDRGKVVLETYGAIALGPYQDKFVGEIVRPDKDLYVKALKELSDQANFSTDQIAVGIPTAASLVFLLELPTSVQDNLEDVVMTEARKYIPVAIEEMEVDWWQIPDQEADSTEIIRVLVVAIRKDYVQLINDVLSEGQFKAQFFEAEIFSHIRSAAMRDLQPVALLDFGASAIRASIIEYGIVRLVHSVSRGGSSLTRNLAQSMEIEFSKAEHLKKKQGLTGDPAVANALKGGLQDILREVHSVFMTYEQEHSKVISKIIITGGNADMPGIKNYLSEMFNRDVVAVDPFSHMENPAYLDEVLKEIGAEFSVAAGLALRAVS